MSDGFQLLSDEGEETPSDKKSGASDRIKWALSTGFLDLFDKEEKRVVDEKSTAFDWILR